MVNSVLNIVGLVCAVVVLATYYQSARTGSVKVFHQANAFLWLPIALPSFLTGVWGAALLTTAFGLIGTYALIDRRY